MVSTPATGGTAPSTSSNSHNGSTRESPSVGANSASNATKVKSKTSTNGVLPLNTQQPLSALRSSPLDLTSVERRGQPTAAREPSRKKTRPHGISEAPTYCPSHVEWRDPLEYMKKIAPEASQYGICKIIPPDSWQPDFAIDTEKFHFRTRKQELNSVEGSTRANLTYLDGLAMFHKQHGSQLHRLPYVDKKPLDLYKLKKAVQSRGGFEQVCKQKKWAEIGRDLGYSGKIMSSLSTSLKNSYQRWLCPYEDYLRIAKPGVHQQLEQEYGGPFTPSPAATPIKRSDGNTPSQGQTLSPTQDASELLQAGINGSTMKKEDGDVVMEDASPTATVSNPVASGTSGSGFTAVNGSRKGHSEWRSYTPESKSFATPAPVTADKSGTPLSAPATVKRQLSTDDPLTPKQRTPLSEKDDNADVGGRRSKRLKKENVPTVAGSHMSQFRPSAPRLHRDDSVSAGEKCETCGRADEEGLLLLCDSCDHAYHGLCLDPPVKKRPEAEWNCARCLVGDGHFGFEEGGLYSLKQFQQKANDFKQGYFEKQMPLDKTLNCHRPVTEEDVEKEFWRLVADLEETVEVEYGADIHCTTHGSGFPTAEKNPNDVYATDPWNLNLLPLHPDSLFRHIKSDISGMTVPWVYVGMIFSTFCWHNEDHYAYSANYQHFGATKTWYGIPGDDAERFEEAMREAVPELFETQPDLLFQLVTLLTPEQLRKAGVRVYAADQRAGQFVVTFPQAYHAGFNHGFNFNEAVNFAPSDWEPYGLASVERLQAFRRQPCFSHDELLYTAAEGNTPAGLTIPTAKWLSPALEQVNNREWAQRKLFLKAHEEAKPHACSIESSGTSACTLPFEIDGSDVQDEEEQCCSFCKAFAYLSRFQCLASGKVLCIYHAGSHACCEAPETDRFAGVGHKLIYRKADDVMRDTYRKVLDKAELPDQWMAKYDKLLEEESTPSLKSLRTLLHEGERIPCEIPSVTVLKDFVDRCNDWVDEAMTYIVRKQQTRRKSEKSWQAGNRKATNEGPDTKEQESRSVDNITRLLHEAHQIGFDCPEILQLQERADIITDFQASATKVLRNPRSLSAQDIEDLLEEGRNFNVDMPELDSLAEVQAQKHWNEKARAWRGVFMTLNDCRELVEEGKKIGIPAYNDHLTFFTDQAVAGEVWEKKAQELVEADSVHYPQLEALSVQANNNNVPVPPELLKSVDGILHKQREAHRQILDITERCRDPDYQKRPKYAEVVEITKRLEDLNTKPNGTLELENEKKRHEDWMRKGKRLFGKSNAPLHILKSHLDYVLERNSDCFDVEHDTPRLPAEPVSREASPEQGEGRWEDPRSRQVFCICRRVEAGMMIECELCHEWYHCKCLKLARGRVKEDDKYTCPICDWRMKIPRDASRPKLEDLIALAEEVELLPFQPDEEDIIRRIIANAQKFRTHVARYCNSLLSTEAEAETQRFYLRKLEGAEVLLAFETNFFRQELHKWCPVAPEAPPILEISLSTRKPRPTKLQKMLVEYGVDNPDDLPDHAKGKANSLRRKAANAEAAAAAAGSAPSSARPGANALSPANAGSSAYGNQYLAPQHPQNSSFDAQERIGSKVGGHPHDPMDLDAAIHPSLLGGDGPHFVGAQDKHLTLEERLLQGMDDGISLHTEAGKSKALEILGRTENGRRQAERIYGLDVWGPGRHSLGRRSPHMDERTKEEDDHTVDQMFKEMTNQDEEDDARKKPLVGDTITAQSLESERNHLDALIDGE